MKRVWPLVALGVLAYLVLAVVTLPASVVVPRVQPPGVTFAGLDGTAWNGSAQVLQIGGSNVGSVAWKLHALPLLLLRADADVNLKRTDGFAQGEVSVSGSRIQLANLAASLPIQALPPQVVGGGWTGSVNARLAELTLVDGWPVSATGTVDLVDLTGPARNPSKLGTFQLKFPLEESTPGTLVGSINDVEGPIQIAGKLHLKAEDRSYLVEGLVATKPGAPAELSRALEVLGAPDAQGRREFSLSGTM
jgi:general secretion pathway protein N